MGDRKQNKMGVCGSSEENSTSTSNFDTGVGVEELNKHLASLWTQYDKNSDGVLDAAEIQALITDAVQWLTEKSIAQKEKEAALEQPSTATMNKPEYLQACITMLDKDGNGKVEKDEFLERAEGMLAPKGTSAQPEPQVITRAKMEGIGSK